VGSEPALIGVDIGGTKIAVAAVADGRAEHVLERPTPLESPEALLDAVEAQVRELSEAVGEPAAVGVGVPSQIEWATGSVLASVNIPLEGVPLRQELESRLGVPVYVDNDANCAALAEAQITEGGPARYLVMLTLGTGVGGGLVIDGRIFRGATGLGAELGHIVVDADGPECPGNCPNRGCLEALCSGTALERDATAAAGRRVKGREVVEAARAGDADSIALLERLGTNLGVGIAGLVNAFEPEHVVIGGGLSAAGDLFLDSAVREAGSRALPAIWARANVSLAKGGGEAGVIGAGVLALQERAASEDTASRTVDQGAR
jgi:glucokinase